MAEVTVGQVCDEKDLVEHPYVHEREVLVHMRGDVGGSLPMHNIVPRLSATPGAIRAPSPALGEHNVEILQGLGCTPEEIRALIGAGVLDMAAEGEAEGKRPS